MSAIDVARLTAARVADARTLFLTIADVFETEVGTLDDRYLTTLLQRPDFWAMAATVEGALVGGLTAFTLPLTRAEESELFIYDVAVVPARQRQGVGRALVEALRAEAAVAGIAVAFVLADNEDGHALDFYRRLGGMPASVTLFTFGERET
ncbi:MAG: GNAT family N-acetyltransferase [Gemmatimonadaceae bacterium]|nr:GNAT family N-acetyltransferase [Gemmatimonadaceae bacterium]